MAIYKMVGDKERLDKVEPSSFGQEGVLERVDLQRILRDQPDVLEEGLLIISEEFGNWQDSNRRIDLLALDSNGRLVVIELKRGDTGSHMDLQAIRYAAMVANMTYQQVVDTCHAYLKKRAEDREETVEEDAGENLIREHLENTEEEAQTIHTEIPRIILASEDFGRELTTCIMWLNDSWLRNENLEIKCVRLQPYRNEDGILLETSVVMPLPEASDYRTRLGQREQELSGRNVGIVPSAGGAQYFDGAEEFYRSIGKSQEKFREDLSRLYEAAVSLHESKLVDNHSYINGKGNYIRLELRLPGKSNYLVSFNNVLFHRGVGEISFWPGWKEIAPKSLARIDTLLGEAKSNSGVRHRRLSTARTLGILDDLLSVITEAYREANGLPTDNEPEPAVSENPSPQS